MSLMDQIIALYPSLTYHDFLPEGGTILLQDDSDGKGIYISKWNHPTLDRPPFGGKP